MLEKFERFIKENDTSYQENKLIEINRNEEEDYYYFTFYGEFDGNITPIKKEYNYDKQADTFHPRYRTLDVYSKGFDHDHEEAYPFKDKDDPVFQQLLKLKLRLSRPSYIAFIFNSDQPYSAELLAEVDKEAERIRIQAELVTNKPNLIRYPDKYNTSTDNFINDLALHDHNNIEVEHSGERLITGLFVIDEIEGLPSHLTNENLMFLEGAFNLYLNGINTFTPDVLYRFATGQPEARVTDKQKERAVTSVERMATIRQELDLTAYVKKYGSKEAKAHLKGNEEGAYTIKSYMLPVEEVTEKVQGVRHKTVYRLIQAPALLKYNDWLANDRIGQIDKELLDTLSTSVEDSLIKRYLAKRLIALENPNNRISNPVISFETLYEHIDINDPDKYKRKKIREDVCAVLDYWKAIKRIKGYKLTKAGRTFTGVELNYIQRKKAIK